MEAYYEVLKFYKAVYRNGALILLVTLLTGLGNNMPQARGLKRKADSELVSPDWKRAKKRGQMRNRSSGLAGKKREEKKLARC
ncbi:hypothetical protein PoB_007213700 [Plakobranchus ocellatus]|uniref:Uncharacterized protein n=1 Tax=Plakobranchus ocellatus TaxID=259542 RepID=A0AAV4DMU6_9GAST|nr:hypothetical protein PoB_007213700 [Plakobranchus ocellatus]